MKPEERKKLEQLLKWVGPMGKIGPVKAPDRVRQALNRVLDEKFPLFRETKPGQMEIILLRILREHPSDGWTLTKALETARIRIKGGGDGRIYGILARLEQDGKISGCWRESSTGLSKTYQVTEEGDGFLKQKLAESAPLEGWIHDLQQALHLSCQNS